MNVIMDFLRSRKQAYRAVFNGDDGNLSLKGGDVLEDLSRFCHAGESAYHQDERVTLIMLGRQEVWLRIQHQLQLTDDQLWSIYTKGNPKSE